MVITDDELREWESRIEELKRENARLHEEVQSLRKTRNEALRAENALLRAVADAARAMMETAECREDENCDHCVMDQALAELDAFERGKEG